MMVHTFIIAKISFTKMLFRLALLREFRQPLPYRSACRLSRIASRSVRSVVRP